MSSKVQYLTIKVLIEKLFHVYDWCFAANFNKILELTLNPLLWSFKSTVFSVEYHKFIRKVYKYTYT